MQGIIIPTNGEIKKNTQTIISVEFYTTYVNIAIRLTISLMPHVFPEITGYAFGNTGMHGPLFSTYNALRVFACDVVIYIFSSNTKCIAPV